jgi:glycosyltransferase involved in cell wall biosynthesis
MSETAPTPRLSVIVPVSETPVDLVPLIEEYLAALDAHGGTYEMLIIVDGGQSWILPHLEELRVRRSEIEIVVLGRTFGEAATLSVGFQRARGELIATLPSYPQVEASGLSAAIDAVEGGADVAVGNRFPRVDSMFNRLQTSVFHRAVRLLTGVRFHDISNGLRVLRPDAARELEIYGDLHRFVPVIAQSQGLNVVEVKVEQSRRQRRVRVSRPGAYLRRMLDLLTVFFLVKFTRKPLRFFGLIGTSMLLPGLAIVGYLGVLRLMGQGIGDRPLLLVGVLMMVLGFQTLCIGMLGEVIIFVHARDLREYTVSEVIRRGRERAPRPQQE